MSYFAKLEKAQARARSLLCVGLDPDPALMPALSLDEFNRAIIGATGDLVCAYKVNLSFYEAQGMAGLKALEQTLARIPQGVPVIGDAKRGDVGPSAAAYARALFQSWGFDAATVNPYLGLDALEPFLAYQERGVYVLCRTSNRGAADFQDLALAGGDGGRRPLFEIVAEKVCEANEHGNAGLVVGATYPKEMERLRFLLPQMPFLIPGLGAQGGDLEASVCHGAGPQGRLAVIAASRSILYASKGPDFAEAARRAAKELRDRMNELLGTKRPW